MRCQPVGGDEPSGLGVLGELLGRGIELDGHVALQGEVRAKARVVTA
jgi:hypothetical protein